MTVLKYNPNEAISKLLSLHEAICDIMDLTEQYFGLPLFTLIGFNFVCLVFDVFYSLDLLIVPNETHTTQEVEYVLSLLIQIISILFHLFVLAENCHLLTKENQKIADSLCKILISERNFELKERVRNFLLHWDNRKVSLYAAGIFVVDRTLFFMVCLIFGTIFILTKSF